MILPYKVEVEFGEIYVFPIENVAPCHDWTDDYFAQGFCWMENQVAFLTLQYQGVCEVTVEIESEVKLRPDALRAIQVPFFVDEDSDIAVCATPFLPYFTIPEGEYCLVYQTGLKPVILESTKKMGDFTVQWQDMWCVLSFIRRDNVEAKILRQDDQLNPPKKLFTTEKSSGPLVRFSDLKAKTPPEI